MCMLICAQFSPVGLVVGSEAELPRSPRRDLNIEWVTGLSPLAEGAARTETTQRPASTKNLAKKCIESGIVETRPQCQDVAHRHHVVHDRQLPSLVWGGYSHHDIRLRLSMKAGNLQYVSSLSEISKGMSVTPLLHDRPQALHLTHDAST
ncbi:hypothetical protein OH77DRAFT_1424518 [Trametes cingulata]|nr:hypothetical protein OH77DRAFT_1424518 [Trametes cingulata]